MPHARARSTGWLHVAVLLVMAAACGDDSGDEADAPDTTPSTTAPSTTAVAAPPAEGPTEWVEVAEDVYRRIFAFQAEPDLDLAREVYSETCLCWEEVRSTVEFLIENGERVEGEPTEVLFVRHELTDPEADLVNITVMGQRGDLRRVDADGEVVQEFPSSDPTCVAYALRADGPDGAYRIYSETSLPECPEEAL